MAAAADLAPIMPVLAQRFQAKTGYKLVVSIASSGVLSNQILNGAPFDVFLGADFTYPEKIIAAGLADSRTPIAYAKGTLVLWARKDSPAQPVSLEQIVRPAVQRVAIADALHAPYGRAAMAALTSMRLIDRVRGKLVTAENVAQAGQFAESGNAQAGLISLTLASSEHYKQIGSFVVIPASQYPAIRQCAVVLAKGRKQEAHAFLDWLLSPEIQGDLSKVGLEPVR